MRPEPQAVVRSTLPKAEAERSALVRTRLPGAVRSEVRARSAGTRARAEPAMRRAVREPVDGEADTGGARSAAATSRGAARSRRRWPGRARRARRRARRVAPSRGGHGGHCHNAVEPRQKRVGPATAASAASRRAGARSDRRERRREGLQRKLEGAQRPEIAAESPVAKRRAQSFPWVRHRRSQ